MSFVKVNLRRPLLIAGMEITAKPASPDPGPHASDVAAFVEEAIADLLERPGPDSAAARRALEQLRARLRARDVVIWLVAGDQATPALHIGKDGQELAAIDVAGLTTAMDRLRRNGTIRCHRGEVSGIEALAPFGVQSFLAAAASGRGPIRAILVVGWSDATVPYGEHVWPPLRIAAAVLAQALGVSPPSREPPTLQQVALDSLADQVAVLDSDGTIVAVNATWARSGRGADFPLAAHAGPGTNYLDACRRAADAGSADAGDAMIGIEAVCRGRSPGFELAYACAIDKEDRRIVISVQPLRRVEGGAIIVRRDLQIDSQPWFGETLNSEAFRHLADPVPLPIWLLESGGYVRYGNGAWLEATAGTGASPEGLGWMQAVHLDDRPRVVAAVQAPASTRTRIDLEARLRGADGGYRWWAFLGAPCYAPDGTLEGWVGACNDVTARRHAVHLLRELGTKLVAAQEAERSRIARELHDDLGQQVALLISKLETTARGRRTTMQRLHSGMDEMRHTLQELGASIHNLSHELHPAKLKLLGLERTLEALCRDVAAESAVPITFERDHIPPAIAEDAALCVFRVTQEALQNAIKHSGARHIDVRLTASNAQLTLRVVDRGRGFDPVNSHSAGLGLMTMRERVELIGGRLRIETAPGGGTIIEAMLSLVGSGGRGA